MYKPYIEELSPLDTMIFVAPTPVFTASPESCVVTNVHCKLDIQEDMERRSVVLGIYREFEKQYQNVFIYDPYEAICPKEECLIYDKEQDLLLYMDDNHISVGASKALAPSFDLWFSKT